MLVGKDTSPRTSLLQKPHSNGELQQGLGGRQISYQKKPSAATRTTKKNHKTYLADSSLTLLQNEPNK